METVKGRGRVIRTFGEALLSLVTPLLSVILVYMFQEVIVGQRRLGQEGSIHGRQEQILHTMC